MYIDRNNLTKTVKTRKKCRLNKIYLMILYNAEYFLLKIE